MRIINFKFALIIIIAFFLTGVSSNAQVVIWSQTYGSSQQDGGESIVLDDNGCLTVTGFKTLSNLKDVLLMKTDTSGNEIWSRTFNIGLNDWGRSMEKTEDGGYIITGMTEVTAQIYDPFLIKTDSAGNMIWHRSYDFGLGADDRGHAVWQTSDGGYIIAGQTRIFHGPFANYDMYVIKTDANGNVQWSKTFFREEDGNDVALGVQQLSDGGYIIGGFTQSSVWACYIIRTDSLGNALWSNVYPGSWQSECYDIMSTPDGGFILTGTESSFETDTDLLITKLNADGDLVWKKIYGTEDGEMGQSIQRLQDGGFIIAGMNSHGAGSYDMYVVRTNSSGDSLWSNTIGGAGDDRAFGVAASQNGNYYVTGFSWSFGSGNGDVYLVKISDLSTGIGENISVPETASLYQNYPNPFNPVTKIKFTLSSRSDISINIFDAAGKLVEELVNTALNRGNYEIEFKGNNLSSGVYYCTLNSEKFKQTIKMLLIK